MAAQTNRMMVDQFSGISLKVALASDPAVPPHSDGDVIVSGETNTGGGAVVSGSENSDDEEDEELGEELGEELDDGAVAAVAGESPAPGTPKPRKRP